jgi:hypothetical protein
MKPCNNKTCLNKHLKISRAATKLLETRTITLMKFYPILILIMKILIILMGMDLAILLIKSTRISLKRKAENLTLIIMNSRIEMELENITKTIIILTKKEIIIMPTSPTLITII